MKKQLQQIILTTMLSVCIGLSNQVSAQTFWTNLNSPNTARYYAIAHDGTKMYASNGLAGSPYAQFYYKQGACAWNAITMSGVSTATSFNNIYCTSAGNLIAIGSQGATTVAFRSTDNGSTWTQSTYSLTGFNPGIVEDASGNIYIYNEVGTNISFVKSTDDGVTFSSPNPTFNIKYLTATGNTLYAVKSGVSVWNVHKSTDGGAT